MARRENKAGSAQPMSGKSYIKTGRARQLPIAKCFINKSWNEARLANIIVVRKHINENITVGLYLVDMLEMGLKDTDWYFNEQKSFLDELLSFENEMVTIDYTTVHNLIYGAIEFAGEYGITPHSGFSLTKMLLEEDDEKIPFMEFEFGLDGNPVKFDMLDFKDSNFETDDEESDEFDTDYDWEDDDLDDWEEDEDPAFLNWKRAEWENFLTYPGNRSEKELLIASLYVFDVCYVQPVSDIAINYREIEEKLIVQNSLITGEAIQTEDFLESEAEIEEYNNIHKKLITSQGDKNEVAAIADHLHALIKRWPAYPRLYNLLAICYTELGKYKKTRKLCEETVAKFPNYLFGRTNLADCLIRKMELYKIPPLLKHQYVLQDMYPHRNIFHISEFVSFNNIWMRYFYLQNDLILARCYLKAIVSVEMPAEYAPFTKLTPLFLEINVDCIKAIMKYIGQATKDPGFRKIMLDRLVNDEFKQV